jgi:hypothetical protein
MGGILATLMALLAVAGLALLEETLAKEGLRVFQTMFFYGFMSELHPYALFFLSGFRNAHFYWFANPLISLLPDNYFERAAFAYGFSTIDTNFYRNGGSQLLLLAVLLAVIALPYFVLRL